MQNERVMKRQHGVDTKPKKGLPWMGRLVPIEIENMVVAGGHCFARWPILVLRIMGFKNNKIHLRWNEISARRANLSERQRRVLRTMLFKKKTKTYPKLAGSSGEHFWKIFKFPAKGRPSTLNLTTIFPQFWNINAFTSDAPARSAGDGCEALSSFMQYMCVKPPNKVTQKARQSRTRYPPANRYGCPGSLELKTICSVICRSELRWKSSA